MGKYINIPVREQRSEESPLLQHSLKPETEQRGATTLRIVNVINFQLVNDCLKEHPFKNTQ